MQNLILVVPGLITSFLFIIVTIVTVFIGIGVAIVTGVASQQAVASGGSTHNYGALVPVGIVVCVILFAIAFFFVMLTAVAQTTFLTGMAGAAWERGNATFADGWKAFRERGFEVFFGLLLLLVLGIAAIILAPVTLLLSLPAYCIFFLYVSTSIVIGKHTAPRAVAESWHFAVKNFVPTLIVAGISIGVAIIAAAAGAITSHPLFFAGGIVAMIFPVAGRAYVALVIVGQYRKLAASANPVGEQLVFRPPGPQPS